MENDFRPVIFVRCPKCLRLLAEFPEIPIFKCYGCDAVLNAKVHSDSCSSENGVAIHIEQISTSPESKKREVEIGTKVCNSDGEKMLKDLEFTRNEMKAVFSPESNNLNQKVEKFFDRIVPVANDSLNFYHDTKSDNEATEEVRNDSCSSDCCSSENGVAIHFEQISASPESIEKEAKIRTKDCNSDAEKKFKDLEFTANEIKTLFISESNDLIQKIEKSSDRIIPAEIDCLNSSCEFEQSPEYLDNDIKSDNEVIEELRNDIEFRLRNRSSQVYDRSISLLDRPLQHNVPHKQLPLFRRTLSTKVMNSVNSINGATTTNADKNYRNVSVRGNGNRLNSWISKSKHSELGAKSHRSVKDYQEKILDKIDNLKISLHRMFSRKSDLKDRSSLSIRATSHIADESGSNDSRHSSLIPFSRQTSKSPFVLRDNVGNSRQEGHRWVRQDSQIRHCRPVSGGAPFVICYKCYRLLQLPIDFLVSSKRIHKLRCGFCSEILVYSFRPRSQAVLSRR